ncbi:pyridoxal-phosphate dependent enzyme [Leucobacter tenebrionis]|uniref:pyridoxal-phosphate dependent enzyme n=1 Tax=Leucobacter tenebrionis TaxID=2873270 RepID=UPI001CA687A7|nr:pyridoxal-phosphate dependent enzyme [Leucobacter tenebrionis]QZY53093.1 pyridoxal-phosphate dependent enzyme [Leucobacter tenebrionis]
MPDGARDVGIWRHASILPGTRTRITLGEGSTPLVPIDSGDRSISLLGKLESQNPTLSFKDRGMALAASVAVDQGKRGLVVASTGNAAVSASAYAAAAGLSCRVIVASSSNAMAKLDACRAYGAEVSEISGDYSDAYAEAAALADEGYMNVSTTYQNEYIIEGYRTVAAELLEQCGCAPGAVIVPIGAGPLLSGIERGFAALVECGDADRVPALVGVQAAGCAPIARAWAIGAAAASSASAATVSSGAASASTRDEREVWRRMLHEPVRQTPTVATAIADPLRGYEDQGLITLDAVRRTGGQVVAIDEAETIASVRALRRGGIWVEPSSAIALAAVEQLRFEEGATVVLMLTGHGVKSPPVEG